jgi:hypothetical protein
MLDVLQIDNCTFFDDESSGLQREYEDNEYTQGELESKLASARNKRCCKEEDIWDIVEKEGLFSKQELEAQNADVKIYDDSLTDEERVIQIVSFCSANTNAGRVIEKTT